MTDAEGADGGANAEQIAFWNGDAAGRWTGYNDALDALLEDAARLLFEEADAAPGAHVVDIGCGAGRTSRGFAEQVGPEGRVLGVDVSGPLLELARRRAGRAPQLAFLKADAQTHPFERASLDLIASRFGVMFFEDPGAAFANFARALRPGGRFVAVAWAAPDENPWFAIPRDAAVARFGPVEPPPPEAPGPFAFQDAERVSAMLANAGFAEVTARRETIALTPPRASAAELAANLGPASRIIAANEGGPEDLAAITEAVAKTLDPLLARDGAVRGETILYAARV